MFCIDRATELSVELLQKMINKFYTEIEPKINKYKNYYDGKQAILNKSYADASKPCNRTVTNYCKNIVDSYCGYLASPGYISYSSDNDIEEIMNILRYNDYQAEDADFLLNALIYGVACELMYIDNLGQVRFKLINPTQCFGVYDDSLTGDLMYFVRIYKASEWDDTDTYNVDVYSDYSIKHYTMSGRNGYLTFVAEEPHYFGQCPANIFYLPDEKSIFDCIISLQDAANELLSNEIDDYSAFCDAYLVLKNLDADEETLGTMKENRVLLLPEDGDASYLSKNISDTQIENMLKNINDTIHKIANSPDFSQESFGTSSGIALRFRLLGFENTAGAIEKNMTKALQRRIELICAILNLKGDSMWRDVQIQFTRNIPTDINETVNMVNTLRGLVSDKTLLAQIPFIQDVDAELDALNEQKEANAAMYGFNMETEQEEKEEDE